MSDKVFKKIRLVGCSSESFDNAVSLAVSKAAETLEGLSWFEVVESRGSIHEGKVTEWQVTIDVGFKLK